MTTRDLRLQHVEDVCAALRAEDQPVTFDAVASRTGLGRAKPATVNLLFRWTDDKHIRARGYDELIWKAALAEACVIRAPEKDARGRRKYVTDRTTGMHALCHYYASVTLADGVNIKELAEYLGHHDPGFTLRLYAHMLPSSHERARKAIAARLFRPRLVASDGAVTELGNDR